MPRFPDWTTCLLIALGTTGILSGHSYHAIAAFSIVLCTSCVHWYRQRKPASPDLTSIEYHFHRRYNHSNDTCNDSNNTITTSYSQKPPIQKSKIDLLLLRIAGLHSLSFAGEDPFLEPEYLGSLTQYCKEILGIPSITVATDGSLVKRHWLEKYGEFIDVLLVSCNSFTDNPFVSVERLERLCEICNEHGIRLMVQTAVDRMNWREDMNLPIRRIKPYGWICYPALISDGMETTGRGGNMAERIAVTDAQFVSFCARHESNACFEMYQSGPEGGVLLDEDMCFRTKNPKSSSPSILEVGVAEAIADLPRK